MVRRVVDGDEELTRAFEIESFAPASYEVARDARHCQENGKPEDHLAAVTAALHKVMKGLDAPTALLDTALSPGKPAKPQILN